MKLDIKVVLDSLSKQIDFVFNRSLFPTFGTPPYQWNGWSYKVQILYTNAIRAVIACG